MPDRPKLGSIDDYEQHLSAMLESWRPEQRQALATAMAERWLPAYEAFSKAEQWGDADGLRRALEAAWGHLGGRRLQPAEIDRYVQQVNDSTPHMDDFDDALEALVACTMLEDALRCCRTPENLAPAMSAALAGFEAAEPGWPLDPEAQPRLWRKVAVRKELEAQLKLMEQIGALTRFDETTLRGLRGQLPKARLVDDQARRARAATAPAGLTNQTAFEQYRRMVESDLRRPLLTKLESESVSFGLMVFGEWMARYGRRRDTIRGYYGQLADTRAQQALMARYQALDAAVTGQANWDPGVNRILSFSLPNNYALGVIDVAAPGDPHSFGPSMRRLWIEARRRGEPKAWEAEDRRRKQGLAHAAPGLGQQLAREAAFAATGDPSYPWAAEVDGQRWRVRLNEFPDALIYSLIVDEAEAGDFHDWPEAWRRG
jgi:uncharacterized protein YjaG (DUF416 family)